MTIPSKPNPYVGLRPFFATDARVFFGRDEQIAELQTILHETRFLPVVGGSGSGKSSLVRAGLIPRLGAGFLVGDRDHWVTVTCRPGDAPMNNLATELASAFGRADAVDGEDGLEATMRLSLASGAREFVLEHLSPNASLLVLVDQFEELFAFRGGNDDERLPSEVRAHNARRRAEAADFVDLLLGLAETREAPVFVVITMRSDFLGDCDLFQGLPEAMNKARYLVPRLSREQLRQTVEGPALMVGAKLSSRLVDRLTNGLGDRQDRLPVLQHALQRTYDDWADRGGAGPIDLEHYEHAGGLERALAQDADGALAQVDPQHAERVFRALTDTDISQRRVRRPGRRSALASVTGLTSGEIDLVIDAFRANDRHFLYRARDGEPENPRIDISHESLIRQWPTLAQWVDAERTARDSFLYILSQARRWEQGKRDPMLGAEFDEELPNWEGLHVTEGWVGRYARASDDFEVANRFIEASRAAVEADRAAKEEQKRAAVREAAKRRTIQRRWWASAATLLVVTLVVVLRAYLIAAESLRGTRFANLRAAIRDFSVTDPSIAAALTTELRPQELEHLEWPDIEALRRVADAQVATFIEDSIVDAQVARVRGSSRMVMLKSNGSLLVWDSASAPPRVVPSVAPHARKLATDSAARVAVVSDDRGAFRLVYLDQSRPSRLLGDSTGDADAPARVSDDGRIVLGTCIGQPSPRPCRISVRGDALVRDTLSALSNCGLSGEDMSRDGRHVMLACWEGPVWLWTPGADANAQLLPLEVPEGTRGWRDIRFSPDGRLAAASTVDGRLVVWSVETRRAVRKLSVLRGDASRVRFNEQGTLLAIASEGGVALHKLGGPPEALRWYLQHGGAVTNVHFTTGGDSVVSSSLDGTAHLWSTTDKCDDPSQPCPYLPFSGHSAGVKWARVTGGGTHLLTVSEDGTGRIWGTFHDAEPLTIPLGAGELRRMRVGPGDSSIAVLTRRGGLVTMSLVAHEDQHDFIPRLDTRRILFDSASDWARDVHFVGNDLVAVTTTRTATTRWRLTGSRAPMRLDSIPLGQGPRWIDSSGTVVGFLDNTKRASAWRFGAPQPVARTDSQPELGFNDLRARISEDGRWGVSTLSATTLDGAAFVWSTRDGSPLVGVLNEATGLAMAFDGATRSVAVSFQDNRAGIYDLPKSPVDTLRPRRTFVGARSRLLTLAFDGTGGMLAAGDTIGGVIVWGLRPGLIRLVGHTQSVSSVVFSTDNEHVFSSSNDGTVRIWTIDPAALIDRIQGYSQVCVPATVRIAQLKESELRATAAFSRCIERRRAPAAHASGR